MRDAYVPEVCEVPWKTRHERCLILPMSIFEHLKSIKLLWLVDSTITRYNIARGLKLALNRFKSFLLEVAATWSGALQTTSGGV